MTKTKLKTPSELDEAVIQITLLERALWEADLRPMNSLLLQPERIKEQKSIWTTKDGRKLHICNMEDTHIWNTLHFLYRQAWSLNISYTSFYLTTPGPNGEMAQVAFEQEADMVFESTWENYLPKTYKNLLFEALRRDLDVPLKLIPSEYR